MNSSVGPQQRRYRTMQNNLTLFSTGKIDTLKHVKKDVMEMSKGTECGVGLEDFQDIQVDDQIQAYEEVEEARTL